MKTKQCPYGEIMGEMAYRYFLIRQANEKISATKRSGFDLMIDEATGHNPFANDTKEVIKQASAIVRLKGLLRDDSSGEQKLIKDLQKTLKAKKPKGEGKGDQINAKNITSANQGDAGEQ